MMTSYYCACWAVSVLALVRAALLTAFAESSPSPGETGHSRAGLLNALWLATRFGLTLLEVSVVVFLAQGYSLGGAEALARTGAVAGAVAGAEAVVESALVFGKRHVPLFLWGGESDKTIAGDLNPAKWAFWLTRSALFASLYLLILRIPRSARWRELLPATSAFFRYAAALGFVHAATAAGSLLLLVLKGFGGYCLVGLSYALYFGFFPSALYAAFLAAFFADSALDLDMAYYSEMRDAGYFDGGGGGGVGGENDNGSSSLLGGGF